MRSLKLIVKLVVEQFRRYPGRPLVTIAGIIASACAVVWVVSGYDAMVSQFDENAGKYFGRYDLLLVPQGPPGETATVDPKLIEQLKADVGVLELNPISQSRVSIARVARPDDSQEEESSLGLLIGTRPPVNGAPPIDPVMVATSAMEPPYDLVDGEWINGDSIAFSSGAAERLNVKVGDEVLVTTLVNQLRLPVVGIVEQAPQVMSSGRRGPRLNSRGGSSNSDSAAAGGGPSDGRGEPGGGRGGSGVGPGRGGRGGGPGRGSRPGGGERPAPENAGNESAATETVRLGIPTVFTSGMATNAVYVRPELAARINGFNSPPALLQVALRDTIDSQQFKAAWGERLATSQPPLQLVDFSSVREGMEGGMRSSSQLSQAYAATGFAALAAVFIIFSLLSMGVSERTREFALLRAVAFSRWQIAGIIAVESLVLAILGWIGGLVCGYLLILVGSRWVPSLFSSGAELGWMTFWLTGATVLLGAAGAAIIPAWRATRIQPIEAMSGARLSRPRRSLYWISSLVGLMLAVLAPLSVFGLPISDEWRVWCYSFVTYPALLIGMVLMTPAFVVLTERVFGRIVAVVFRLDPRLLESQLSSHLWRTIGATLALSVGLGLYASTQTWGFSMLVPFMPGKWLPDVLVSFQPGGLDADGLAAVKQVEGVNPDKVLPLAVEQALFNWSGKEAPPGLRYDNAVLLGFDAPQAIGGDHPLVSLDFIAGERPAVIEELNRGGTCIISYGFSKVSGLGLGDSISFTPPNAEKQRVTYHIAGIVALPGWQWTTKFSGVRRHFVRTACMIFVDRQTLLRDFHLPREEFCWLNLRPGADLDAVEAGFQQVAEKHSKGTFQADGIGAVTAYRPFARMTATETVRRAISLRAHDMIWGMSQLPLITLCIMSLAVVNAVIASVRSRQWEFGILRSVGATRWQLVRLVIAETLQIGVAACLLSLSFGLIAGWCGVGMAAYGNWGSFSIDAPSFLIPWKQLGLGFAITLGLCGLAAVCPAVRIGRREPLSLLTAGRSAR
ncbi:MAG: ABC transporter permease [Planctomycetaceae bacterium]